MGRVVCALRSFEPRLSLHYQVIYMAMNDTDIEVVTKVRSYGTFMGVGLYNIK